jgi:NitT/TauT family transport system substrate-binding protein
MPRKIRAYLKSIAFMAAWLLLGSVAYAQRLDHLNVAVGQCGNWDSFQIEIGTRTGVFVQHGIGVEARCSQNSDKVVQAVRSGSADVGIGASIFDALSAYAKDASIRIIASSTTGSADFWIVNRDSPLHTIKDAVSSNTIAYSTNGSPTQYALLGFNQELGLKARPVATGDAIQTATMLLSRQVDIGWSAPPFGLELLNAGQIRIFAKANDVPSLREQTIRVDIANAASLNTHRKVFVRFMQAFREITDWMYADAKSVQMYADYRRISLPDARRTRDEFFSRAAVDPDVIKGLDKSMIDTVKYKFMARPLTSAETAEFLQVPLR